MEASTAAPILAAAIDPPPVAPEAVEEAQTIQNVADEQLNDLELQVEAREWPVRGEITYEDVRTGQTKTHPFDKTYVQKPLSYTAMLQFTGLIGDRISTVMERGVTFESVLGDAMVIRDVFRGEGAEFSREDFSGVDSLVRGLAKLAGHIPTLIEECQCIWLRVPFHERPAVTEIWGRSPDDGGLSMQDGEDMMNLFIAQNYEELEDFFVERLGRILGNAQTARKKRSRRVAARQPSRPSSTSQAITQSQ